LIVAHKESGRRASAQAADGTAAVDLARGGPHDPEKAFGVHQYADGGSLAKGNDLWGFRLGPLGQFDRLGLVHFDHRDAASVNEAALEPDVLTILSTKHLANSNNSVSAWMLLHNSGYFAIWNFPKMHYC